MKRRSHVWSDEASPPEIQAHSLAKHEALRRYLLMYVAAYTQNIQVPGLKLTIVDGFAGGNFYAEEGTGEPKPGSPTIILDAVREARIEAQARRTKTFTLDDHYVFVERHPRAFQELARTIGESEHAGRVGTAVDLVPGDFLKALPAIEEKIRSRRGGRRALFILDQCGYSKVPIHEIARILSRFPKAEIIFTFAVDYIANFLGGQKDLGPTLKKTGLDDPRLTNVDKTDPQWKRVIQFALRDQLRLKAGARFYTPFFIRSEGARRDLWLIHLSQHWKARDVMAGLHWELGTATHYGGAGLNMFGYVGRRDSSKTRQLELDCFRFDNRALDESLSALREDLPRKIHELGSTSGLGLYADIANDTPADYDVVKKSLRQLCIEKEVLVTDVTGKIRRTSGIQGDDDIITVPKHKRLFLPF